MLCRSVVHSTELASQTKAAICLKRALVRTTLLLNTFKNVNVLPLIAHLPVFPPPPHDLMGGGEILERISCPCASQLNGTRKMRKISKRLRQEGENGKTLNFVPYEL